MIQFQRTSYGLKNQANSMDFIDTTMDSKYCFNVVEFPDKLFLGKNLIRINANIDNLAKNANVYIDILDSNGNPLYYEISNVKNKDNSRSIIAVVYPDTSVGLGKIYMASRLKRNPLTNEPLNGPEGVPNVLWTREIFISPTETNQSRIIFDSEPVVTFYERREQLKQPTTINRKVTKLASATSNATISPSRQPYQFSGEKLQVDINDPTNITRKDPSLATASQRQSGSTALVGAPGLMVGESRPSQPLPEYSGLPVISFEGFQTTGSMSEGTIWVRGIRFPAPQDYSASLIQAPDYSSSIVTVRTVNSIEVSDPFNFTKTYINSRGQERSVSFDRFQAATNFTISYFETVQVTNTSTTQSFVTFEFRNIEPIVGTVDYTQFFYKPIGQFGEFHDVGKFYLEEQNLLTHSSSVVFDAKKGMVEQPLGFIDSAEFLADNWYAESVLGVDFGTNRNNGTFQYGFYVNHSELYPLGYYALVHPLNGFNASTRTEYNLHLCATSSNSGETIPPQIDIYISGSSIQTGRIKSAPTKPLESGSFGTYVGSIFGKAGINCYDFPFIAIEAKPILPKFIIRSGNWEFGNIEITARKEKGFSPGQAKIAIPMTSLETSAELLMKIEYYNENSIPANYKTELRGVYFSGSSSPTSSQVILPPNIISSSAQVIFSQISGVPAGLVSSSAQINYYDIPNSPKLILSASGVRLFASGS